MSGFKGFAQFASPDFAGTSTTAAATLARRQAGSKKNSSAGDADDNSEKLRSSTIRPSPIYTGSDGRLILLFRKIGQKRDPATKVRALDELSQVVFGDAEDIPRPEKIAALCHLVFLHETKLGYDNNFSVRAGSYKALTASKTHVPKAWMGLFVGDRGGKSSGNDTVYPASTTVGMAWAASRGDPAADVAKNAAAFIAEITGSDVSTSVIKSATCSYANTILSCKRASSLQSVINPTSVQSTTSGGSSKSVANAGKNKKNKAETINEAEKEELEECYERVVLSVLSGLGSLVQSHPETSKMNQSYVDVGSFPDPTCITRILQSSRGSFRREAYNLVAKLCQFAPSLIISEPAPLEMAPLIPNLLSSEKESTSVSPLLEMILTYLAAFRTEHKDTGTQWQKLDCVAFTKSLSKSLRRACYGAPASAWCPMILPLVASLPRQENENIDSPAPLAVVQSLWEGRNEAISMTDKISIVSAVVECVTFFLLRSPKDTYPVFSQQSVSTCGKLFIETVAYYLTGLPSAIGLAVAALDDLSATISRDLNKLDEASANAAMKARGIDQIQWLWEAEGLQNIFVLEKNQAQQIQRFMSLLTHLSTTRESGQPSHLLASCRNLFQSIMLNITSYSNKTCKNDEGEMLLAIIRCCGVENLFTITKDEPNTVNISVEAFILNDLLRWILVHGSISARSSVQVDFKILKLCLYSMTSISRQGEIWETVLRELIKAYCDYTTIADGLSLMVGYNEESCSTCDDENFVKCKTLDKFATDTANSFVGSYRQSHDILRDSHDEEDDICIQHKGDLALFLRTCAGISDPSAGLLVSSSVVKEWITLCCQTDDDISSTGRKLSLEDESGSNVLLDTLLALKAITTTNYISNDEAVQLLFQSWHEGGKIWSQTAASLLDTVSLKDSFVARASSCLCDEVKQQPPSDHAVLELVCQAWAARAKRIFDLSNVKCLDSVGLSSKMLWDTGSQSEFVFLCLMHLLYLVESTDRQELVFKNRDEKLFVHILQCISDSRGAMIKSYKSRTVRNQQLADIIGGQELSDSLLEGCCVYNIELLSELVNNNTSDDDETMARTLTTLTFLVSLLLPSDGGICGALEIEDDVNPTNVKEGESLWYEKREGERVKATVMKVHFDDFPDLYFTIRVDGSNVEKQTVAKKLKRFSEPKSKEVIENPVSNTDCKVEVRDRLGHCILNKLLRQTDIGVNDITAECINVIISQCGFNALTVGIGSVKYEVFKKVSSIESLLCNTMEVPASELSLTECVPLLRFLSLSMGYGIFTLPSWKNVNVLKLDPSGSIGKILDLYEDPSWIANQQSDPFQPFHESVAMWLTVALHAIADTETYRRLLATMRLLSGILLQQTDSVIKSIYMLNVAASVEMASIVFTDTPLVQSEDEKYVLSQLTRCFVDSPDSDSTWTDKFSSLLQSKGDKFQSMFMQAAKSCSNELVDCLFSLEKQWCAFQILDVFAGDTDQDSLQSDDSIIQEQFAAWRVGMDHEEAVELEEDIRVTASWLPSGLMTLLESLGKDGATLDHEDKSVLLGYLLAWIACLNIMDTAGLVDMRNRSSIGAFIKQTKVLGVIMKIALMEADLAKNDKEDIFACVDLGGDTNFVASDVALLVLFRTVEALPTLVKTWFNDYCPKYWQQKFSSFVEKRVAPATLQRELDRIKKATCFEEMSVNGSCASREVVATYQQDECQLSVMIKIPPTFPLRNVEVDCQKTLGIPSNRWRRWALQIMLMLNNQDGNILEALLLWKRNVDKEFDGVEPCPVCYSVLCIKTHAMPNLECKTCNNRFHTSCLYKWFQESGKSQCVLCQQPWSGTKV